MQLTIELETDEIATYAHLAKILQAGKEYDVEEMGGIYPLPIFLAMDDLLNNFECLLEGIDSPFVVGDDAYKYANHVAHRMRQISDELLEMKKDFEELRAKKEGN